MHSLPNLPCSASLTSTFCHFPLPTSVQESPHYPTVLTSVFTSTLLSPPQDGQTDHITLLPKILEAHYLKASPTIYYFCIHIDIYTAQVQCPICHSGQHPLLTLSFWRQLLLSSQHSTQLSLPPQPMGRLSKLHKAPSLPLVVASLSIALCGYCYHSTCYTVLVYRIYSITML